MHRLRWGMWEYFGVNRILAIGNIDDLGEVDFLPLSCKVNCCRRDCLWWVSNANSRPETVVQNYPSTLYELILDILVYFALEQICEMVKAYLAAF